MDLKYFFQVRRKTDRIIYRLFQLPLLKVVDKRGKGVFLLFGFLPIFCIDITKFLRNRYERKILQLQNKKKINIGFLIRENCKWSYEDLYFKLKNNRRFEPIVLVVDTKDEICDFKKNIEFFNKYNYRIVYNKRDFDKANIDILFYEQPWLDLISDFTPRIISKKAITLYVPYGVEPDLYDNIMDVVAPFYRNLYKSFIFSEKLISDFCAYNITNVIPVGHPRLDAFIDKNYNNDIWKSKDKIRIIYAPHHTFQGSLHMWASWEWNGEHILKLAKKNQDKTEWVFKPHPRFRFALGQLLKSVKKADNVFKKWERVSTIYDTGNYLDLFKTADIMISDCCSFKIEWLPTGKPFIQLLSHYKNRQDYGKNTDYYSSQYYKADSIQDIDNIFDMLINKHQDPKRQSRLKLAKEIPLGATEQIYEFVCNIASQ